MAQSFDDLFGNGSSTGGKFLKWEEQGDEVLMVQTGDAFHQIQKKFQTGEPKYLVKNLETGKTEVKFLGVEGFDPKDFDDEEKWNVWQPKDLVIPVTHIATRRNGEVINDSQFDTKWELNKGDQHGKFKDALMELSEGVDVGTKYVVKRVGKEGKMYKYSVRIKNS